MKIFLDSANLDEAKLCVKGQVIQGITTNPSLMSKEPKSNYVDHIKRLCDIASKYSLPVSAEIFYIDYDKIIAEYDKLLNNVRYDYLNVKIPIGFNEIVEINKINLRNLNNINNINCTAIFSYSQACIAINAKCKYVSFFYNRMIDFASKNINIDIHPIEDVKREIKLTRQMIDLYKKENQIICGSIRKVSDVFDCHSVGAHIVTLSYKLICEMFMHNGTVKAVEQFNSDFSSWMSK